MRIVEALEFVCISLEGRDVLKHKWIPIVCGQEIECGDHDHVIIEYECIAWELHVNERGVDDDL